MPPETVLGTHLIAEFYGASALIDAEAAIAPLTTAATAAGATVLDVHAHSFGERAGFTGIALLAESHISVHTWPEHQYAAIDLFICGTANLDAALDELKRHFRPTSTEIRQVPRGLLGQTDS